MTTKIEWTRVPDGKGGFKKGETWNPAVGCYPVSPGCLNCYAEEVAGRGMCEQHRGLTQLRVVPKSEKTRGGKRWNGRVRLVPHVLSQPLRWRDPRGVFVGSMTDIFHDENVGYDVWVEHVTKLAVEFWTVVRTDGSPVGPMWRLDDDGVPDDAALVFSSPHGAESKAQEIRDRHEEGRLYIAAMFGVMAATPQHTYMLLTKRPENEAKWFAQPGIATLVDSFKHVALADCIEEVFAIERTEPVAEWPGYFVTSKGRVLSDRTNSGQRTADTHEVKPMAGPNGHARVMLYLGGTHARLLVHRLVLEAFVRPANGDEQACHINGDPTNNALWNLRWGSQSDNWSDRKRHGNRRSYAKITPAQAADIRSRWTGGRSTVVLAAEFGISDTQVRNIGTGKQWGPEYSAEWPLHSVWLGVTAEDQPRADARIPVLLSLPAAVHFVSYEPACGGVEFTPWLPRKTFDVTDDMLDAPDGSVLDGMERVVDRWEPRGPWISWLIAGGESGNGARPSHPEWFRSVRDQCVEPGVPFFGKQWGEWAPVGEPHYRMFDTHQTWVNKASSWMAKGDVCVDMTGKVLARGGDFDSAVYPIAVMRRVGKGAAGRELDGRVWDEFPSRDGEA
jgi:protein gp37